MAPSSAAIHPFSDVTGEEEGMLGSDAFAHTPTVPARQIVADLNTDGISLSFAILAM